MSNKLAVIPQQEMTLQDTMQLGDVLAKSGFFQDSRDAAQAIVKILAGRELGFGPVASMTGVNVIKGKVALSANLIAASVKRSGRYNYRVTRMDNDGCSIDFYEGGEKIGTSEFTAADAKAAGLAGDNWRKFPRNMLFARAMSNGAKWFCPDLSGGPLYTPDELGAEVDGESGEVIDITPPRTANGKPASTAAERDAAIERNQAEAAGQIPKPAHPARPMSPEDTRQFIVDMTHYKRSAMTDPAAPASPNARGLFIGKLTEVFAPNEDADKMRRSVVTYLFGVSSSTELTKAEVSAGLDWLIDHKTDDGDYLISAYAVTEAKAIERQVLLDAGQNELPF